MVWGTKKFFFLTYDLFWVLCVLYVLWEVCFFGNVSFFYWITVPSVVTVGSNQDFMKSCFFIGFLYLVWRKGLRKMNRLLDWILHLVWSFLMEIHIFLLRFYIVHQTDRKKPFRSVYKQKSSKKKFGLIYFRKHPKLKTQFFDSTEIGTLNQ